MCFTVLIFNIGCTVEETHENRPEDRIAAESVAEKFYGYVDSNEPEKARALISNANNFRNTLDLSKMFTLSLEQLGRTMDKTLDSSRTTVKTKGRLSEGKYVLYYNINHEKINSKDIITLIMEEGKIRIADFKVAPYQK